MLSSLSVGFLRDLLVRFKEEHAAAAVDILEGSTREHIAGINERRLDIAFVARGPPTPRCDVTPLWQARVFIALPDTHPQAKAAEVCWAILKDKGFILRREWPGPEIHDFVIQPLASLRFNSSVERYHVGRKTLTHVAALAFGISLMSETGTATQYVVLVFRPLSANQDLLPYIAVWLGGNDNSAL